MKKSRNKKWRHVYPYTCKSCGKKRIAFDHARAAGGICTKCETPKVDPNQKALFEPAGTPPAAEETAGTSTEAGQA